MTRIRTASADAEDYLRAVRRELADLPDDERGDLLEDLALHLAEVTDDADDEESSGLVARLGAPAQYAAELRAAAGLPARADARPSSSPATVGLLDAMVRSNLGRFTRAVWRHPAARELRAFVGQLGPAWWVLRAYLVVALVAWRSGAGVDDLPVPPVAGSTALGAVTLAVAVAVSVALGRRTKRPGARVLALAVDVTLALAALAVLSDVEARLTQVPVVQGTPPPTWQLASPSGPVTNILPYSRDGQPLADVLLFDQDGRPLRTEFQLWWPDGCARVKDHPTASDGVPVEFVYPVAYVVAPGASAKGCAEAVARPPVPLPAFPAETVPATEPR